MREAQELTLALPEPLRPLLPLAAPLLLPPNALLTDALPQVLGVALVDVV